jgi:ribosomal protein S18 acetylase RimI-like enzyme
VSDAPRQLTWIAHLEDILKAHRPGDGPAIRPARSGDKAALAEIYFASYPRSIVADPAAAREEMKQTFGGEYGSLDLGASPVVVSGGEIIAAVLTVGEAPWVDTPPGPFIIEVMVRPEHRGRGLARRCLAAAARTLSSQGKQTVALRVMSDNEGALALYRDLGFRPWEGSGDGNR